MATSGAIGKLRAPIDGASLGVDLIETALDDGASVTVTTGTAPLDAGLGNINLNATLNLNDTMGSNTLTLSAHNNINLNAAIIDSTPGGQSLDLILVADSDAVGGGTISMRPRGTRTTSPSARVISNLWLIGAGRL